MTASPQHRVKHRVPHVRDGFIVANVGIVRSATAPAHLCGAETSKSRDGRMTASTQRRVPHPFRFHRKGWVIERSETAVDPYTAETSKVEVN
jgi:hypothetical protein